MGPAGTLRIRRQNGEGHYKGTRPARDRPQRRTQLPMAAFARAYCLLDCRGLGLGAHVAAVDALHRLNIAATWADAGVQLGLAAMRGDAAASRLQVRPHSPRSRIRSSAGGQQLPGPQVLERATAHRILDFERALRKLPAPAPGAVAAPDGARLGERRRGFMRAGIPRATASRVPRTSFGWPCSCQPPPPRSRPPAGTAITMMVQHLASLPGQPPERSHIVILGGAVPDHPALDHARQASGDPG